MGEKKVQLTNFVTAAFSPHVRNSWLPNPGNFCLWNPESGALESGIPLTKNPESTTVLDSLTWRMGGGADGGDGGRCFQLLCTCFINILWLTISRCTVTQKEPKNEKKMRLDKEDMRISKISLKGKNFRNLITFIRKKKRKIVEKEIANLHFYFGQCDKMLSNVSSNQRSKL